MTDELDDERRAYEVNCTALAEIEKKVAFNTGKLEAIYEAMPADEELITDAMAQTGGTRERVVERLKVISERELAALRDGTPTTTEDHLDPAVTKFRALLDG